MPAELKREQDVEQREEPVRCERMRGLQSRVFTLAGEVNDDEVAAQYQDGARELIRPEKTSATKRKIPVNCEVRMAASLRRPLLDSQWRGALRRGRCRTARA